MTYSLDFRKKVLTVKAKEGLSFQEAADRFQVGKATIFRWSKRLEPQKNRQKAPYKIPTDALLHDIQCYRMPTNMSAPSD